MIGSKYNKKLYKNLIEKSIPSNINLYVEPFGGGFGLYKLIGEKVNIAIYNDINTETYNQVVKEFSGNGKNISFYNLDYKIIFELFDSIDTLFYVDPPYYKKYYYEYNFESDEQHIELFNILKNIKGKFLLSYQDREFITELYKGYNIDKFTGLDMHLKPEITIKNY